MNQVEMDARLWKRGAAVADWYRTIGYLRASIWELDFVRGIHEGPGLTALAKWLGRQTGLMLKLQSVWLDKHAWASWTRSQTGKQERRELADVAVIVRRFGCDRIHRWMWILQAKRTGVPFAKYTGASSAAEIELLQEMPDFSLDGISRPFNLRPEFSSSQAPLFGSPWPEICCPWSFLDFHGNPYTLSTIEAPRTPVGARWPACIPSSGSWADARGFRDVAISSYAGTLLALLSNVHSSDWVTKDGNSTGSKISPGAPVDDPRFPEWQRLYIALLENARANSRTGHARSPWNGQGSVVQMAGECSDRLRSKMKEPIFISRAHRTLLGADESFIGLSHEPNFSFLKAWKRFDSLLERLPVRVADRGRHEDGNAPPEPPSQQESPDGNDGGGGGPAITLFIDVL